MGRQETYSVTEVQRLCEASEYLDGTDLHIGDKTVSFDGNIVYFRNKKPSAIGQEMLIPTQIKGEIVATLPKADIYSYPVNMRDLRNYFINGGVIYFVVLIEDSTNVLKTYAKILLPIDIQGIIEEKEQQKTITIHLRCVPDSNTLARLCSLFAQNKAKQGLVITGAPCPDFMSVREFSFSTSDIAFTDPAIAIVKSSVKYIYVKQNGFDIPIDMRYIVTSKDGSILFHVGDEDYILPAQYVYTPNETVITIDGIIKITLPDHGKQTNYVFLKTSSTAFFKVYRIAKLVVAINDSVNNVYINSHDFSKHARLLQSKLSDKFIFGLKQVIAIGEKMKNIGLPLEAFNTQEVIDSAETISILERALVGHKAIGLNCDNDCGVYYQKIGSKYILLEYRKKEDGDFILCDYLHDGTFVILDCSSDVPIQISKWFAILPERIVDTIFCRDDMMRDLRASNNTLDMGYLTFFILALIRDFDHNHSSSSLSFASDLHEIVEQKEPDSEYSTINRMQIIYRQQALSHEQEQELQDLKSTTQSEVTVCCACILLKQYEEFRGHYDKLSEETKSQISEWPIFNLLPIS